MELIRVIDKSYFFFFKALLFGIPAMVAIPKKLYKKFFLWGFMFGAIGNIVQILIIGRLLHLAKYSNMGVFSILGIVSFWTPIAWMFVFMLFFYFLPVRKTFLYLYVPGFGIFGFWVGWVLQNLGLYFYIGKYVYYASLVYTAWFSLGAWAYIRSEKISLK